MIYYTRFFVGGIMNYEHSEPFYYLAYFLCYAYAQRGWEML